jgi:hypothetical protein
MSMAVFGVDNLILKVVVKANPGGEPPFSTSSDGGTSHGDAGKLLQCCEKLPDILPEDLTPLAWNLMVAGPGAARLIAPGYVACFPSGVHSDPDDTNSIFLPAWPAQSNAHSANPGQYGSAALVGSAASCNSTDFRVPLPRAVQNSVRASQLLQVWDNECALSYYAPVHAADLYCIEGWNGVLNGAQRVAEQHMVQAVLAQSALATISARQSVLAVLQGTAVAAARPSSQQASYVAMLLQMATVPQFLQWLRAAITSPVGHEGASQCVTLPCGVKTPQHADTI